MNYGSVTNLNKYMFNDSYDEKLIETQIRGLNNELFTRCLNMQKNICGVEMFDGVMSEFTQNPIVNQRFNLRYDTFSTSIVTSDVNYFSKKELIDSGQQVFTDLEVCKDNKIFKKKVMLFVNGIFVPNIAIIPSLNLTYVVIYVDQTSNTHEGLTWTTIHNWIKGGAKYTLMFLPTGNYYDITETTTKVMTTNGIPLNLFDTSGMTKANLVNNYIVACNTSQEEHNLTAISFAPINVIEGVPYITVSERYKSYIRTARNGPLLTHCRIYNNINLRGLIQLGSARQFSIPLKDNPVPPTNLLLFEYNPSHDTYTYLHNARVTLFYPNVYTVQGVEADINLVAMMYYHEKPYTKFINPLKDYMEFDTEYEDKAVNGTLPDAIRKYVPLQFTYSIKDYLTSPENPNPDLYKLDKLIFLFFDDTSKYEGIYRELTELNKKFVTKRMITKQNVPAVWTRLRYNNETEISQTEHHETFDSLQTFIKITHSEDYLYPIAVWIDGVRFLPKYRYIDKLVEYLYLPKSLIKDDTVIEMELINIPLSNRQTAEVQFANTREKVRFPANFSEIADQHLIFYNKDTYEFIPNDSVIYTFGNEVESYRVLTSLDEFLKTKWDEYVVTGDFDSLGTSRSGFFKYIAAEMLYLYTDREELRNIPILIQNCDNYLSVRNQNLGAEKILTFENFTEDPTVNRFRVYRNGMLLTYKRDYEFTATNYYNRDVLFTMNELVDGVNDVFIEYLPYKYLQIGQFTKWNDQRLDLSKIVSRPFCTDYYDIYVDGKKLSSQYIDIITQEQIRINTPLNNSYIAIYEKGHDKDLYGNMYKVKSMNDQLIEDIPTFRTWLENKRAAR